jgi:hypothetical protein
MEPLSDESRMNIEPVSGENLHYELRRSPLQRCSLSPTPPGLTSTGGAWYRYSAGDLPTNVAWRNEIYVGDVAGEIAGQPWYMLRTLEWTYVEWKAVLRNTVSSGDSCRTYEQGRPQ